MTGEKMNSMFGSKPDCNCGYSNESRFHILLDCSTYHDLREFYIKKVIQILTTANPWVISEAKIRNRWALANLMLDPSWFRKDIGSPNRGLPNIMTKETTDELEKVSRIYCYQIYRRRFAILSESYESEDETDDSDEYSLHDTTEESDESFESE